MTWPAKCPNCGQLPRIRFVRFPGGYQAHCSCGYSGPGRRTDSAAISAWNRQVRAERKRKEASK